MGYSEELGWEARRCRWAARDHSLYRPIGSAFAVRNIVICSARQASASSAVPVLEYSLGLANYPARNRPGGVSRRLALGRPRGRRIVRPSSRGFVPRLNADFGGHRPVLARRTECSNPTLT